MPGLERPSFARRSEKEFQTSEMDEVKALLRRNAKGDESDEERDAMSQSQTARLPRDNPTRVEKGGEGQRRAEAPRLEARQTGQKYNRTCQAFALEVFGQDATDTSQIELEGGGDRGEAFDACGRKTFEQLLWMPKISSSVADDKETVPRHSAGKSSGGNLLAVELVGTPCTAAQLHYQ